MLVNPEALYALWCEIRLRQYFESADSAGFELLAFDPNPERPDDQSVRHYSSLGRPQEIQLESSGMIPAVPQLFLNLRGVRIWVECRHQRFLDTEGHRNLGHWLFQAVLFKCQGLIVITPFAFDVIADRRSWNQPAGKRPPIRCLHLRLKPADEAVADNRQQLGAIDELLHELATEAR